MLNGQCGFAREAKSWSGNGEQLPLQDLASRANSHTGQHHHANPSYSVCVVIFVAPMRKVRGDKKLDANCCLSLASSFLSPLTL
jgi:hypothetical protein